MKSCCRQRRDCAGSKLDALGPPCLSTIVRLYGGVDVVLCELCGSVRDRIGVFSWRCKGTGVWTANIFGRRLRRLRPSPAAVGEVFVGSSMPVTKEALCKKIRHAFGRVTLGNGIGLFEADGVDDYADEATLKAYRDKDEKEDWQRIPLERLRGERLCFTDAEGMGFHLLAFMIAAVMHGRAYSPVFMLTDRARDLFVLFTPQQKEAVRKFLLFIRDDPEHDLDRSAKVTGADRRYALQFGHH